MLIFCGEPRWDHGSAYVERAEIYDLVAREGITGFATIAGDRHSFWSGFAAEALPPQRFEPIGIAYVTGSISAPGLVEAFEHKFPRRTPVACAVPGRSCRQICARGQHQPVVAPRRAHLS
jgi:hypothetical protein